MQNNTDKVLKEYFKPLEPSDKVKYKLLTALSEAELKENAVRRKRTVKRHFRPDMVAAAAALLLVFGVLLANADSVKAAIGRIFKFIPGIGIVSEEDSTALYMDGMRLTAKDGSMSMSLNNVYVTDGGVYVVWNVKIDGFDKADNFSAGEYREKLRALGCEEYFDIEERESGMFSAGLKVSLSVNGKSMTAAPAIRGGSYDDITGTTFFKASKDMIGELSDSKTCVVKMGASEFDVKLRGYDMYSTVEDIGPSQTLNGITLIAMPEWYEDRLEVTMYNINMSDLGSVYAFENLYSENPSRPYVIINGEKLSCSPVTGSGEKLVFDLTGLDAYDGAAPASAELHIPQIFVNSGETAGFRLKLDKSGEITDFDKKIELKNGTLTLVKGGKCKERVIGGDDSAYLAFTFEGNSDNIMFNSINFMECNGDGAGWSFWHNEENGLYEFAISSDGGYRKLRTVKFQSVVYAVTDEYVIKLK